MSVYNESSFGNRYYFEIEWGVPKKIYLSRFSFGFKFYSQIEINGQKQIPRNPVFIYPDERINMYANSLFGTIKEFYDSGSIFPRCSIGAEVTVNKQIQLVKHYGFQNIKILEPYGRIGDIYREYYKIQFDNWS